MSHDPCPAEHDGVIDIGHDVRIRFSQDGDGNRTGLIESHPTGDGTRCSGFVTFNVPAAARLRAGPRWTVESADPLTLSPSILCSACGHHGFIRAGRWVPA